MLTIDNDLRSYMRALTDDERRQLEENLVAAGRARDPLIAWGDVLLDGHNRYEICTRLRLPFDVEQAAGVSSREDALRWIVDHQLGRRNLTSKERDYYLGKRLELEKRPHGGTGANQHSQRPQSEDSANRSTKTAERLAEQAGVSRATVERARDFALAVDELADQVGADVRQSVIASDAALSKQDVVKLAKIDAPAEAKKKVLEAAQSGAKQANKELKRLEADVRKATREAAKAEAVKESHPLSGESYRLEVADIRERVREAEREDVTELFDAIITDPPYPADFLDLFGWLGDLAAARVKPGGNVLVMSGQSYLGDVIRLLESGRAARSGLEYRWTLCYFTPGQSCQVFGRHVKSNWKPVLWFTNGTSAFKEHVDDVVRSDGNDKRFHEWGQDVGGMAALVERFTDKNDVVLDPFCGAGTTGVAAVSLGRLFVGWDVDADRVSQSAKRLKAVSRA